MTATIYNLRDEYNYDWQVGPKSPAHPILDLLALRGIEVSWLPLSVILTGQVTDADCKESAILAQEAVDKEAPDVLVLVRQAQLLSHLRGVQ